MRKHPIGAAMAALSLVYALSAKAQLPIIGSPVTPHGDPLQQFPTQIVNPDNGTPCIVGNTGCPTIASDTPFTPVGNASLAPSGTSSNVAIPATSTLVTLTNYGTVDLWYNLGTSNAILATTSNNYLGAGRAVTIAVGANTYLAAITGGSTGALAIQGGTGGNPALSGGTGVSQGTVLATNPSWTSGAIQNLPLSAQGGLRISSIDLSGNYIDPNASVPAGANTIGKVGIDQSSPGNTNLVYATPFNSIALIGNITTSGGAVTFANTGYGSIGFATTGTWAGTLAVQGSLDNSNWTTVAYLTSTGSLATSFTANSLGQVNTAGLPYLRITATNWTSGTAAVTMTGGPAGLGPTAVQTQTLQVANSDRSGSVTTGGAAQTAINANANRKGWCITNDPAASETLYVRADGNSASNSSGTPLQAGAQACNPPGMVSTAAVSVYAATTGHKWFGQEFQ